MGEADAIGVLPGSRMSFAMITPRSGLHPGAVAAHYDDLDRYHREIRGEHVHHGLWLTGRETAEAAVRQLIALVTGRPAIGRGGTARVLAREHGAAAFFAEAHRVLKPGGRLIVCAWLVKSRPRRREVRHLLEPICREG